MTHPSKGTPSASAPPPETPAFLDRGDGTQLAYHATPARDPGDRRPGLIFCGGFMSDMTGTKATALEAYAREQGLAFVRFDYLGHGASSEGVPILKRRPSALSSGQ